MSADLNARREASYIKHIALAVAAEDPSAPYRTFFDNWFAYHACGPFLNSKGRPRWFNKADPVQSADALKAMHYISDRAWRVLIGEAPREDLIKDHTIPVAILRDHLLAHRIVDEDLIRNFLIRNYKLGVITSDDDNKINSKKGFRSGIGDFSLLNNYNPITRYKECELKMYFCTDKFETVNG